MTKKVTIIAFFAAILIAAAGCTERPESASTTAPTLADKLVFYDWEEDIPQAVFDAFTEEFGVEVVYEVYETQEEALENMRAGQVYDVVVLDNDFVGPTIERGLLAEIDYRNIPNVKNISPSFRDLAYDPANKHSLPYSWGTSGLIVRSDLVPKPIARWSDLWTLGPNITIGLRDEPRDQLGAALRHLGYSINTEDPGQVQEALEALLELKDQVVIVDSWGGASAPLLLSGDVQVLIGWAEDVLESRDSNENIEYVLPEEGCMLWGDNYVIPANSPRKHTAEVFLNYILRPDVGAQIVNANYYATANQASLDLVDEEIREDAAIFPSAESLVNAEVYMTLSREVEALYQAAWAQFKAAMP
jgi:spermidine/putrescine transport system substrate-binding protein